MGGPDAKPLLVVSYSHEDRDRVEPLVRRFRRRGWWVFWDRDTTIGARWRNVIDDRLRHASCVVVVWTRRSVRSTWVLHEAAIAAHNGVLKAVRLDDVNLPEPYGEYQWADLNDWSGRSHPELNRLLGEISRMLSDDLKVQDTLQLKWEREHSQHGVSEARTFVKRVRAQAKMFKGNPAASAVLQTALKEVASTYRGVTQAIDAFLVPVTTDEAPSVRRYRGFASGQLKAEIEASRGHCTQIAQSYIEEGGLRDGLLPAADTEIIDALDNIFVELGVSDRDLFAAMAAIGDALQNESVAVVKMLRAGESAAAKRRLVDAERVLEPLVRDLTRGESELNRLAGELGIAF